MYKGRLLKVSVLSMFVVMISFALIGGCNNNKGSGDLGDDPIRTCDLSGGDSACQVCANQSQEACCTLTTPPGCGTVHDILNFTQCSTNHDAACKIAPPTPRPPDQVRTITFVNNCGESVWVGGQSIHLTPLLCAPNPSTVLAPAIGDCGPLGGQDSGTIPDNPEWQMAPPWSATGTPTWEIPSEKDDTTGLKGIRQLTIPDCWDSGSFYARTGCTAGDNPGELTCQTANCGSNPGAEDCGGINENKAATVTEFTLNAGIVGKCDGIDSYDVSFVAGYTMLVTIDPESNPTCPSAGIGCKKLPDCPWDTFVFEPDDPNQIGGFIKSTGDETATCLSPFSMASIGLPPFEKFTTDEMDRLGCVGNYGVSPWVNNFQWGVCMTEFKGSADTCTLSAPGKCDAHTNVPPLGNSTPPCCEAPMAMCDPYGQCDKALKRTAKWPEFKDGSTMKSSTLYIENIHGTCGDNNGSSDGVYAWSYDDGDQVLGLSNALKSCSDDEANYTITFCAEGSGN